MHRTYSIASGRERSVRSPALKGKEILKAAETALVALTDRLFAALERDRARHALGRMDERALKDLGLGPTDRDRF